MLYEVITDLVEKLRLGKELLHLLVPLVALETDAIPRSKRANLKRKPRMMQGEFDLPERFPPNRIRFVRLREPFAYLRLLRSDCAMKLFHLFDFDEMARNNFV